MPVQKQIGRTGDQNISPRNGSFVVINYQGWIRDLSSTDNSRGRNICGGRGPVLCTVQVGRGLLVRGLEEQILFMKKGEMATFTISSDLAYGTSGLPNVVPPNTDVIFEVQLIDVDVPDPRTRVSYLTT